MNTPLISVIIPTYNALPYLREALDSLLNQTYPHFEAICVNDGSTDNSLTILREYENKDKRIKIIDTPNGGYGKAMNVGLDAARGKYMAILEPDDYLPPDAYEKLVDTAEKHALDIVKGRYKVFTTNDSGQRLWKDEMMHWCGELICPRRFLRAFRIPSISTWSCLYKLEFLRKYNIRHQETPGASYQDIGFCLLTWSFAERFMFSNNCVYCYRKSGSNSSSLLSDRWLLANGEYAYALKTLEKYPKILQEVAPGLLARRMGTHLHTPVKESQKLEYLERLRDDFIEMEQFGTQLLTPHEKKIRSLVLQSPTVYLVWEALRASSQTVLPPQRKCVRCLGLKIWESVRTDNTKEKRLFGIKVYAKKPNYKSTPFIRKNRNKIIYRFFWLPVWRKKRNN